MKDNSSHLDSLRQGLDALERELPRLERWGLHLAAVLPAGARLLLAGNGGSATHAEHLATELVGRYVHDRIPLSAIALCADASAITALANDYAFEEVFVRGVLAHGRPGDVLMLLSTSGRSPNVLRAAMAAREAGLRTWAMTGPGPNPLASACDDALAVPIPYGPTVQEVHQVAVHMVCNVLDAVLLAEEPLARAASS